jgi:hypothetical protein
MDHSAHRRHRLRRAPPQRGPYGLNKNGNNLRQGYSQRGRHNSGGHNGLGDRIQGRLPATELPANEQTTLPHNSGPKLDGAADNAVIPFQAVQLQPLTEQEHQQLENLILQRIQTRLPGRVRNLAVRITDDSVELTGECRTYYTKQMAQHVAMGVLDYQQLINSINVAC